MEGTILEINDLTIHYITEESGTCKAVNNVAFSLRKGETLGLVGETGAGKTTIARGIMRLVPDPPGKIVDGTILFNGKNLLEMKEKDFRSIRGNEISMIFQDPMTALNPTDTVGDQIAEVLKWQKKLGKTEAKRQAIKMMEMVGIPGERYGEYPHQFSGGMKQRIVIAIALACRPKLLIADEPTTALDVTIQAQVLDMMRELKDKLGTSMILITHDLGVVAEMCDWVAVIYAGEIVEYGHVESIYDETAHPYTIGLFNALPRMDGSQIRLQPVEGMMPDPSNLPKGCKFAPRCPYKTEICEKEKVNLKEISKEHYVRCNHVR